MSNHPENGDHSEAVGSEDSALNAVDESSVDLEPEHSSLPEDAAPPHERPLNIQLLTILVEGGLLVAALLIGIIFRFHDPAQPLDEILQWPWLSSLGWGVISALPMFLGAVWLSKSQIKWCREFTIEVDKIVKSLFKNCSILGLFWISIWAGLGEEMMFRWCLQGGLQKLIPGFAGVITALLIASVIFGVLHWVNKTYAILATMIGIYFGVLMIVSQTVLVPMIAHAIYDFAALLWITRRKPL